MFFDVRAFKQNIQCGFAARLKITQLNLVISLIEVEATGAFPQGVFAAIVYDKKVVDPKPASVVRGGIESVCPRSFDLDPAKKEKSEICRLRFGSEGEILQKSRFCGGHAFKSWYVSPFYGCDVVRVIDALLE